MRYTSIKYTMNTQEIILGGGCFWCIEAVYSRVQGVEWAISGYMMGQIENPSYKEVCSGTTGHNEVVKVTFDADDISLAEVLEIFWTVHDPTTLNRQGNDRGTQYRSGIYYNDETQLPVIQKSIQEVAKFIYNDPIVTEVMAAEKFYEAEAYHQEYFTKNPNQGYCAYVVGPKVAKFRQKFKSRIKTA